MLYINFIVVAIGTNQLYGTESAQRYNVEMYTSNNWYARNSTTLELGREKITDHLLGAIQCSRALLFFSPTSSAFTGHGSWERSRAYLNILYYISINLIPSRPPPRPSHPLRPAGYVTDYKNEKLIVRSFRRTPLTRSLQIVIIRRDVIGTHRPPPPSRGREGGRAFVHTHSEFVSPFWNFVSGRRYVIYAAVDGRTGGMGMRYAGNDSKTKAHRRVLQFCRSLLLDYSSLVNGSKLCWNSAGLYTL